MSTKTTEYCKRWEDKNPGYRKQRYYANLDKMRKQAKHKSWKRRGLPTPTREMPQLCECCGSAPNGKKSLNLDHDHAADTFRGWLCWNCNTAIGKLGDNLVGVLRAVDYLKRNG